MCAYRRRRTSAGDQKYEEEKKGRAIGGRTRKES
jgi:hypothetical protein